MACHDCDDCSYSVDYGGACDRFEYDCPFTIIRVYGPDELKEIRNALKAISNNVNRLKELDLGCVMDELANIEFQLDSLNDKTSEDAENEWNMIKGENRNET